MAKIILNLLIFATLFISTQSEVKPSKTYAQTRKLLAGMDTINKGEEGNKLAKLFQIGDERIEDLITALGDKDEAISLHAQLVIRYLGNQQGMNALHESYRRGKEGRMTGPVPLPLTQWDFDFINKNNFGGASSFGISMYIDALTLDGSAEAAVTLDRLAERYGNLPEFSFNEIRIAPGSEQELAQAVLQNAPFNKPEDKKYTTVRLLAYNGAKDKALIEIYVNRGVLMETWHHVVIRKSEQGWRFYSIKMVALS
jgi:hypothetical protein